MVYSLVTCDPLILQEVFQKDDDLHRGQGGMKMRLPLEANSATVVLRTLSSLTLVRRLCILQWGSWQKIRVSPVQLLGWIGRKPWTLRFLQLKWIYFTQMIVHFPNHNNSIALILLEYGDVMPETYCYVWFTHLVHWEIHGTSQQQLDVIQVIDLVVIPWFCCFPFQWEHLLAGWWFQTCFIFTIFHPYLGKIPILTNSFSDGLKPPTS